VAWKQIQETETWRFVTSAVIAFGVWRLADLAVEWFVAMVAQAYPGFTATNSMRWMLLVVLGLFAVAFIVIVAEIAGRRVALLVASILLGINIFQAVATLAWRIGAALGSSDDLLGLTRYGGEAIALVVALALVEWMPSIIRDREQG
jgi:hypothetical protein